MAGLGPLDLSAAVHAVAVVLAGEPVQVVGLTGRAAYTFESATAVVTVSVHLNSAQDTERAADLLVVGEGRQPPRWLADPMTFGTLASRSG